MIYYFFIDTVTRFHLAIYPALDEFDYLSVPLSLLTVNTGIH